MVHHHDVVLLVHMCVHAVSRLARGALLDTAFTFTTKWISHYSQHIRPRKAKGLEDG